jgi:hypothetical protein
MGIGRIVYGFDHLIKLTQEEGSFSESMPIKVIKAGELHFNHFIYENILA